MKTLYRPIAEGEVVRKNDKVLLPKLLGGLTDVTDSIGMKVGKEDVGYVFRPVHLPTFEEVKNVVGNDKLSIGIDVYQTTLKLMGIEVEK